MNKVKCIFPINPKLPDDFDCTPNHERSESELNEWWEKPFIVTSGYIPADSSYDNYVGRVEKYGMAAQVKSEWEEEQEKFKKNWFENFPTGDRYEVRCLDGGAWDRSTNWGFFGSLEEAEEKAKNTDVMCVRLEKDGNPEEVIKNIVGFDIKNWRKNNGNTK